MTQTPERVGRVPAWLAGAILAPLLYVGVFTALDLTVATGSPLVAPWAYIQPRPSLAAVVVLGGISGHLWANADILEATLGWLPLVGWLTVALPWLPLEAFTTPVWLTLTLGLVLAGSWLLVAHQETVTQSTAAIAALAGGLHLTYGVLLQVVARPFLTESLYDGVLYGNYPAGLIVLPATAAAAVIWWRVDGLRWPAIVLGAWMVLGAVGLVTATGRLPMGSFIGPIYHTPAPDYLLGVLTLPWLMVLARQAERLAPRLTIAGVSTTD